MTRETYADRRGKGGDAMKAVAVDALCRATSMVIIGGGPRVLEQIGKLPDHHPVVLNPNSPDEPVLGFFLLDAQAVGGPNDLSSRVGYTQSGFVAVVKENGAPYEMVVPITPDNVRRYAPGLMDHPVHLAQRIQQSIGCAQALVNKVSSQSGQG